MPVKSVAMPTAHRRHDSFEQFAEWLESVASGRFDRRYVFEHGNWAALYDAVAQALEEADDAADCVSAPRWVLEALADVGLPRAMTSLSPLMVTSQRGRPRSTWNAKQWRRDMIDWQRFLQVWYRRIARHEDSPLHPPLTHQRAQRIAYRTSRIARGSDFIVDMSVPYPWDSGTAGDLTVFDAVAAIFHDSIYGGSPPEIRKSWERVGAALKRGEAWRYYPSKWLRYDESQILSDEIKRARS